MPISSQFFHLFFLFAASLVALSARRVLEYQTVIGKWACAVFVTLTVELVSYSMLCVSVPSPDAIVWYLIQVASLYVLAIVWFFFIDSFSDLPLKFDARILLVLLGIPFLILVFQLFNNIPTQSTLFEKLGDSALSVGITSAYPQFPRVIVCLSIIVMASLVRLGHMFVQQKSWEDRKAFLTLFLGMFFLIGMGSADLAGVNPLKPISLLQISLAVIGLGFYFLTQIYRFGGILPVGQSSVFAVMRDGSIILNAQNRIIDLNPQAEKYLNGSKKDWIKKRLEEVWPQVYQLIVDHPAENFIVEEIIDQNAPDMVTQISITRYVGLNNITTGRLVVIRNITGRDQLEITLIERNQVMSWSNKLMQELAALNLTIQATDDLAVIFDAVKNHFAKIDLDYFIALEDPVTNELKLDYLSLKLDLVTRFDSIANLGLLRKPLSRSVFPELYSYLDCKDKDIFTTTFRGNRANDGRLIQLIDTGLKGIGIDPNAPMVVFHLTVGDRVIGIIGIWGSGLRLNNLDPLRIFSSQVAWAIERVNLYAQDKQQASELARSNQLLTALANVSAQMGRSSESSAALDVLGQELESIGLHCILGSLDSNKEFVTIQYGSFYNKIKNLAEFVPGFHFGGYRLPRKLWPGIRVTHEGVAVWYQDVFNIFKNLFPSVPANIFTLGLKQAGISDEDKLCILPLIVDGQVNGVLPIWGQFIQEKDTPALMVFAYQVAEFLHKTQGYEQELARAANLARANNIIIALSNVAASLETTTNLKDVYETLGREMHKVQLQCMIGILEDEQQSLQVDYLSINPQIIEWAGRLGFSWTDGIHIPRYLWPTDKAVTHQVPFWDPDPIGSTCRMFPFLPRAIFEKTYQMAGMSTRDQVCYLPMIIEENVIGIMGVWGPNLKDDDIPGLSVFSNQVASAIKNTKLYNQAQEEILIRREAEARIQAALTEKEVLLKEIHHRVKNNLQIITSLLNLQIMQSDDASLIEGLRESQNRVRAMALIHEKLYRSDDLARINFSSYLRGLADYLLESYAIPSNRIFTQVEISDILLNIDIAIPCGLIVNELLTNALKHAFPNNKTGTISIACRQTGASSYSLVVADNGIGLGESINLSQSNSLGLKLVSSLIRQINGQLTLSVKSGTRYEIKFSQ